MKFSKPSSLLGKENRIEPTFQRERERERVRKSLRTAHIFALHKRCLYRATLRKSSAIRRPVSVCLSVRPSVTLVYCIETAKEINLFSRLCNLTILVFFCIRPTLHNFKGNPLGGVSNTRELEKSHFSANISLSWERYKIRLKLLRNVNRKSYIFFRTVPFPVTFSHVEGHFSTQKALQ